MHTARSSGCPGGLHQVHPLRADTHYTFISKCTHLFNRLCLLCVSVPNHLKFRYCDLCVIHISGSKSIPVDDFIDSVVAYKNLKVLNMLRCTQFSELHMLQMPPRLENINYLNANNCEEIIVPVPHYILGILQKFSFVDF